MTVTLRDIEAVVSEVFGLQPKEIHAKSRYWRIVRPRQIAMTLGVEMTSHGLKGTGRYWKKDHTTALHAVRAVSRLCEGSPVFAGFVDLCRARVAQRGSWMAVVKRDLAEVAEVPRLALQAPETSRALFVQTPTRSDRMGREPFAQANVVAGE